jgi:hypothetical protein
VAATVKVVGDAALRASMDRAEKALPDIETEAAARIIAAAIPAAAPRRTGRLGGSFTASTQDKRGTLTTPVVYAVPIHWGRPAHNIAANPFVFRAANATEGAWTKAIEDAGQKICDQVRGA